MKEYTGEEVADYLNELMPLQDNTYRMLSKSDRKFVLSEIKVLEAYPKSWTKWNGRHVKYLHVPIVVVSNYRGNCVIDGCHRWRYATVNEIETLPAFLDVNI